MSLCNYKLKNDTTAYLIITVRIQKTDSTKCLWEQQQELSFLVGGNANCIVILEDVWQTLTKLNVTQSAVVLVSIYPTDLKFEMYIQDSAWKCL